MSFSPLIAKRSWCAMAQRTAFFIMIVILSGCAKDTGFDPQKVMTRRPVENELFFDFVGVMQDVAESTKRHLHHIRDDYGIEIVIAAFPTTGAVSSINQAAATVFSHWDIGRQVGSRGLLILLVDDVKQVKVEVGFELEDVFTDAFCGHIQDLQLQPRFAADQLDIGIIAVIEEVEARARFKFNGDFSPTAVAAWDSEYLSQGAGAGHRLNSSSRPVSHHGSLNRAYPAGDNPADAWQTMIRRWKDKVRDPDLGVFTPLTRLTFRDFTNLPDARFEEDYRTYASKDYEVIENGDVAAIYFGRKKGWDNAPFLFCRTAEGWQFDIVHQRRFIRMGRAPDWGVEFSEYPHLPLLMDAFHFNGQDIPLGKEDRYTVARDAELARSILDYEHRLQVEGEHLDDETLLTLGRLYTMAAMNRKAMPLLKKIVSRNPGDPRPHKYLAIAHVDAHYQYDAAIAELLLYSRKEPRDIFGHQFLGYLYYCKKMNTQALAAFKQALAINPEDIYSHFYLCYVYAALRSGLSKQDAQWGNYKAAFDAHIAKTRSFADTHPIRVQWLDRWLKQ